MNISKYRQVLTTKLTDTACASGWTIFGSFVREKICNRSFDLDSSDIDIYVPCADIDDIRFALLEAGISVGPKTDQGEGIVYANDSNGKDFKVIQCTARLTNDILFTNIDTSINVDFVISKESTYQLGVDQSKKHGPQFGCLDFECNSLVWDKFGIRVSQNTGTYLDDLDDFQLKRKEIQIIKDAQNKVTKYIQLPFLESTPEPMDELNVFFRRKRLERICKLLHFGWTITNLESFSIIPETEEQCVICQYNIEHKAAIKMSCCEAYHHIDCFTEYGQTELSERTFVRCVQRCTEFNL